jgi:hypothetical protein
MRVTGALFIAAAIGTFGYLLWFVHGPTQSELQCPIPDGQTWKLWFEVGVVVAAVVSSVVTYPLLHTRRRSGLVLLWLVASLLFVATSVLAVARAHNLVFLHSCYR